MMRLDTSRGVVVEGAVGTRRSALRTGAARGVDRSDEGEEHSEGEEERGEESERELSSEEGKTEEVEEVEVVDAGDREDSGNVGAGG